MFNVIEKEMAWRRAQGLPEGFETLKRCKPIVAVGAEEPLGGQVLMADYYREWTFSCPWRDLSEEVEPLAGGVVRSTVDSL